MTKFEKENVIEMMVVIEDVFDTLSNELKQKNKICMDKISTAYYNLLMVNR